LEVGAYAGEVGDEGEVVGGEVGGGADAAEEEEWGGVEDAGREDYLAPGVGGAEGARGCGGVVARVGAVDGLALEILDACGAGLVAVAVAFSFAFALGGIDNEHACDEAVGLE
jgi:hypothetical protein